MEVEGQQGAGYDLSQVLKAHQMVISWEIEWDEAIKVTTMYDRERILKLMNSVYEIAERKLSMTDFM